MVRSWKCSGANRQFVRETLIGSADSFLPILWRGKRAFMPFSQLNTSSSVSG